ncbi:MAG: transcriptional regulator [Desulfovibrio sp.]|uniref:transcriptional regulator n=1 Tax=Desulfovibrio sp. 7SRBS1 TaxID=3378064 RepID=UPI003B418849
MLFRLLIFVGVGFILYKLFTGDKKKKSSAASKKQEKMAASGQMLKDPVCGTYVSKDSEIRVREGDKVHAFCSYECRDKFLKQIRAQNGSSKSESLED